MAFHVEPAGALFGPGSSLYFLSEGSSLNPYGDAVYELETNATRALDGGGELVLRRRGRCRRVLRRRCEREENHYYQAGLLEAPDLWLWDVVVSPGSKSFPFTVDELASSSSAGRLSVVMQGASDFEGVLDHHVRVRVNGTIRRGDDVGREAADETLEVEVEPGVLREGANTLELEDVGDTGAAYSMVFLNRFSVSLPAAAGGEPREAGGAVRGDGSGGDRGRFGLELRPRHHGRPAVADGSERDPERAELPRARREGATSSPRASCVPR